MSLILNNTVILPFGNIPRNDVRMEIYNRRYAE